MRIQTPSPWTLEDVVVVVPAKSGTPQIVQCVARIRELGFSHWMVVWDGPPTSQLGDTPQRYLPAGSGAARARNLGVAETDAPILFFVDADVLLGPAAPREVLEGLKRWEVFIGSYDDRPQGKGTVAQYRDLVHHYIHQNLDSEVSTFFTAIGVVSREAWEKVGGFRSGTLEDVDLGYRLTERGYRVGVAPHLQGSHLKPWTLGLSIRTEIWVRAVPWTALLLENRARLHGAPSLDRGSQWSVVATWGALASPLVFGLGGTLVFLGLFLGANVGLFAFLNRKRGARFAVYGVGLTFLTHWLRGLGFWIAVGTWLVGKVARSRPVRAVAEKT